RILSESTQIVICADFRHGVFTPRTLPRLVAAIPDGVLRAADSQITDGRWGNILDFQGFDLLFANEREAQFAVGEEVPVREAGRRLYPIAECDGLLLKMGAHGLLVHQGEGVTTLPAFAATPIVDPIGAGDALLAY